MKSNPVLLALCSAAVVLVLVGCGQSANRTETSGQSDATGSAYTQDQGVTVSQVEMGRSVDADQRITDKTTTFKPNDTIYTTVITNGAANGAELKVRWLYEDGQVIHESTEMIYPTGNAATSFHISKPEGLPAGNYKVEILVNGAVAGTETFSVQRT